MAFNSRTPDDPIWSSEQPTPTYYSPAEQVAGLMGAGFSAYKGAKWAISQQIGKEGGTVWDLAYRLWRNTAMRTPMGLGQTFRVSEFMSPWLSPTMQGLTSATSVSGSGKVGTYYVGPEFTSTPETRTMLKGVVGEKAYVAQEVDMMSRFDLLFERPEKSTGRGSLFIRPLEVGPGGIPRAREDWKKLSDAVHLMELRGPGDALDIIGGVNKPTRTSPAYLSVMQTIGVSEKLESSEAFDKILTNTAVDVAPGAERARYGFIPSLRGSLGGEGALARRAALLGAYPAFGMQRFNRLIETVLSQVPVLGEGLKKVLTGKGPLSLTVTPGPAHTMFAKFGLQAAKVGGAYLLLRQLDYYRSSWGAVGQTLVSGGISAGIYAAMKRSARGFSPATAAGTAMAAFFGQMILPGFDQGTVEGIATTGTKIDILRAGVGTFTGANIYRRTLEGFLPGVSDWKTGALLGLGVLGLSYGGNLPKYLLKHEGSILPEALISRIGFAGTPPTGILRRSDFLTREYQQLAIAGPGGLLVRKGDRVPPWQISPEELGKLSGKNNIITRRRIESELFARARVHGVDATNWLRDEIYQRTTRATAEFRDQYLRNNPVTESLVRRIEEINTRRSGSGVTNKALKYAETTAAEFYHSFFGASLRGEQVESLKAINAQPKVGRAGILFFGTLFLQQLLTGGLLGSLESPEELSDIYSGKKYVEVKSGRFWEGGGTPFQGLETTYMRPHAYHLMMTKARDKAEWGQYAEEYSPIEKFFLENFSYRNELLNYYDRPYPMCLHPDSIIWTSEGEKAIDQMSIGDEVLNANGEYTKVTSVSHRECWEGELYRIKIAGDNRELKLTAEHKVLAIRPSCNELRGGRCRDKEGSVSRHPLEWIPAKDLKRGYLVVIPKVGIAEKGIVKLDLASLGYAHSEDTVKGLTDSSYWYLPIRGIGKTDYQGEVWDIAVEKGESFLSLFIVHNSSAAFANIPIIGNLLAATIGQVIKPPRLMHSAEMMRATPDGRIEFVFNPEFRGPSAELGGKPLGIPRSPYGADYVMGRAEYQATEMGGLIGYTIQQMQKALTGSTTFGTQYPVFASAGHITSPIDAFWDANLGGLGTLSEPIRRYLPRAQSELEEYNPLINTQPSWLPAKFRIGDPYSQIEAGYARLPGRAYETLHPELQGMDPEEYPLIYKYSILADLSPDSRMTSIAREQLYNGRLQGITTEMENRMMDDIGGRLATVLAARNFDHVEKGAIELPGSFATQAAVRTAQSAVREVVAPVEYLLPLGFRPFQKLMSDRDMIEQYEWERLYGSRTAFWDKPWRDWLRPSLYSAAHLMGYDDKPLWRKEADDINEYFDKLEFVKWMKLAEAASSPSERKEYLRKASQTRVGVNPQGDALAIYQTLPAGEKAFFDAFSFATGGERDRILEMIPQDQIPLYKAVWNRAEGGDKSLYPGSYAQINEEHMAEKFYEIEDYFKTKPFPKPDFIGWRKDVDVNDVKLRYIETLGKDIHDFDMWERQQRMEARKPYLIGSEEFLFEGGGPTRADITRYLTGLGKAGVDRDSMEFYVNSNGNPFTGTHSQIYYNDDREVDILGLVGKFLL